jgi:type I restriction-modification system DNA methylase subunit
MDTAKKIRASLKKLYGKIKSAKEISEEDLRVAFVKSGFLEVLGYEGELKDVRFEKNVKGKRSDLLAFDDYQNVVFVVEFKKPGGIDLEQDFAQLWERYVKPLRARYGVLTDGLELLIYERINSNWERKLRVNLGEVTLSQCEELSEWLKKPSIERTKINEVLRYFERFDKPEERVNLSTEIAQQHFFDSFELKEDSIFVNLVQATIGLFDFELERSKFLKSAYNFWKISYAKKPEKVPENWKRIMDKIGLETSEENLFKFMFCLESAYSLFTRLILAKACEDYKLPYIDFSDFIKREIERTSYRGDITLLAWAVTTKNLIESMKQKLVKSVFEGDIFYWWEDSYRELRAGAALYSPRYEKQKGYFGEALAEIILTLYKFDFSEIVGDPLGTLYQRYFDKETRKALGEFYTPKEVVEYILDAVGYEGRSVIDKRLLDPACGSGTFLVEALRRYLKASEQVAEEDGWSRILEKLCNEYCIAGFDIHPFATFMAQMQFMLVLIPAYKKAMEEDPKFVLNRLPIFRTDSLVDETKGEAMKVTIETFESGIRYILIDTSLPVDGGNLKIKMPYDKDVFARTDLLNVQEYFAALQAVFDTVKESAWQEKYEVDKEKLERNFKQYLPEKEWSKLISFFTPYAEHFLQKFEELKETFGDGKLIKSIEDLMLAAILKNYVKYDFVVGNPPYVRKELIPESYKNLILSKTYEVIYSGNNDLYVYFITCGISKLSQRGKFGFIVSNKFTKTTYGNKLRSVIEQTSRILKFLNLERAGVFRDATTYPCILILEKDDSIPKDEEFTVVIAKKDKGTAAELIEHCKSKESLQKYSDEYLEIFQYPQASLGKKEWNLVPTDVDTIIGKIDRIAPTKLRDMCKTICAGIKTGANNIFVVNTEKATGIEESLLKPVLHGKDIKKYSFTHRGDYLIYTAGIDIDSYPNTKEYLLEFKDELSERKDGAFISAERKWFELNIPIDLSILESKKIISPDISNHTNFTLEQGHFYCLNTTYLFVLRDDLKPLYEFVLGVLNSKLIEFYFAQISPPLRGGYYRFTRRYVDYIPIRLPQTPEEQDLADEITKNVEQILEKVKFEQKNEKFPDEYIQDYRSKGEEFDSINISFNSNHKVIELEIEKDTNGRGYNITIGKKEKPIFVESEAKVDYVVTALKGKSAKKDEKMQLLIPKSDTIVEEILKKLEEDKAKTKSPSVAELEEEINELVYKLYGLNEKDVKVIEDFLRRF